MPNAQCPILLQDIGKLEEYVEATGVIMIFVSKGYFKSGNCLREARCTP